MEGMRGKRGKGGGKGCEEGQRGKRKRERGGGRRGRGREGGRGMHSGSIVNKNGSNGYLRVVELCVTFALSLDFFCFQLFF